MKIKLKDIAKLASVSETAVSLVLNDKPTRISQEKQAEIRRIAKENNYRPNLAAKNLASKTTGTIGLIIPDLENPFFSGLAKSVEDELRKHNYLTFIVNSDDNHSNEKELLQLLVNSGVDGMLMTLSNESFLHKEEMVNLLKELSTPYILVDRTYPNLKCNKVYYNNRLGGYLATKHLIDLGHKNIGFIKSPEQIFNGNNRYLGYLDAMREANYPIDEQWSVESDFKYDGGYQSSEVLLEQADITAIVCANDLMAFGVMKKAREMNIKIPEDVSLIGYDNLSFGEIMDTQLTTVKQDMKVLGVEAVRILLSDMSSKGDKIQSELEPELLVKDTVRNL